MKYDDSWEGIVKEYIANTLRNYEFQWVFDEIEYYLSPVEYNNVVKYDLWDTNKKESTTYNSALEALTTAIVSDGKTAKDLYELGLISFDIL